MKFEEIFTAWLVKLISSSTDRDFTILHIWILAQGCGGRCLWQSASQDSLFAPGQGRVQFWLRCHLPALPWAVSVPQGKGCMDGAGPDISELRNHLNKNVKVKFLKFKECKAWAKKVVGVSVLCVLGSEQHFPLLKTLCAQTTEHSLCHTAPVGCFSGQAFWEGVFSFWQSSQGGTSWWKQDFKPGFFQHSHQRRRVYKGGKSHAHFPFVYRCVTAKSSYFPHQDHRVSQNLPYSSGFGSVVSKEKSPCCLECSTVGYQSRKTSCLPRTLGKQSSPDSSAKWFFGRLTPLRIKDVGVQPSGQAGTGPGQDIGILVEPEILSACLYQLLTLVLKGELPKMWANGPRIDKIGIIFSSYI